MTDSPQKPIDPEKARYYDVPPGTPATTCRGETCDATIYFIAPTGTGRGPIPIDCDVPSGKRPSEACDQNQIDLLGGESPVYPGRGVSHFLTCVDADMFTRKKR